MIENRDFVITGLQSWDIEIGSNAKDIAVEISRHNRILYVNTPLDHLTLWKGEESRESIYRRQVIKGERAALRQVNERLWVLDFPFPIFPVNKLPGKSLFDFVNRINNKKMYRYVSDVLKGLGFEQVIHINDNDLYRSFYVKEYLNPVLSVYYRRDNLLSVDYWKRNGIRLEPQLVAKSDLVLANSIQLADAVRIYNPEAYDVGQGVDLSDFDNRSPGVTPPDMTDIRHPVVGYSGYLTALRLDVDLICSVVTRFPDLSFVFVGPEDEVFASHALKQLPNAYFLGNKKNEQVPDYIGAFDICINPQLLNEATIGNYPRKVDEYLALGKPVVATRTSTMQLFENTVILCDDADSYAEGIKMALQQVDNPQGLADRIRIAHSHTWENSVAKMYSHIESQLNR